MLDSDQVASLASRMNRAYPDAIRNPPADLVEAMTNHPKDRHVLATAVLAEAEGKFGRAFVQESEDALTTPIRPGFELPVFDLYADLPEF